MAGVDASGYPQSAPLPANNVLQSSVIFLVLMVRANRWTRYVARSGAGVVAGKSQQQRAGCVIVDLLPAGLELENQNLANGSPAWSKVVAKCRTY